MLATLIDAHRDDIVARTRSKVASRPVPVPTETELQYGVPLFLDQLTAKLRASEHGLVEIAASASLHGGELLALGVTIGQVVHDYGDVCQAITELAIDVGATIRTEDFRTLNLCLDIAIAEAVTEYSRQREQTLVGQGVEHLGFLAHELRNLLNTSTLAFQAVQSGHVAAGGHTAAVVARSLAGMSDVVARSLAEVRLGAAPTQKERIVLATLAEEIEILAMLEAKRRAIAISFAPVTAVAAVDGDVQIILSIITNLVQNACKFTRTGGSVSIEIRVSTQRVLIDVADECGGLPPGRASELFAAFEQRSSDRSGLGLGLAIAVKGAIAMGGRITVRDIPGTGCVFTLDLPKASETAHQAESDADKGLVG
jgi:signal transduction histidine kinase